VAHEQYRLAVQLATQAELVETAAQWAAADAETHALVGQCAETRSEADAATALSRDNFTLERGARALALCGQRADVDPISRELAARFPDATLTVRIQRPLIDAASAIQGGDAARALTVLDPVSPYDHARSAEFWPAYLRGQAHLAAKDARQATAQFDAIVTHRGEAPDSMLYPLAQLGAARAFALGGETEKARAAYDAFLKMWEGADPELKTLQDARREASRLR
jgi:hypothetical protein